MWNNDNLSRCHCFPCIYFAFNEQVRNNDNLSRCHCFPCIYFAFNQQEYAKIGSNIGTHCKNNLFWRKTKTVSVGWCGHWCHSFFMHAGMTFNKMKALKKGWETHLFSQPAAGRINVHNRIIRLYLIIFHPFIWYRHCCIVLSCPHITLHAQITSHHFFMVHLTYK